MTTNPLQQIIGTELAAVTFGRDYVQLNFDGPNFSALTPITVTDSTGSWTSRDEQFRNRLCDQIGKTASMLTVTEHEALLIKFTDKSSISLSLRIEHYSGPEAAVFNGHDHASVVI